MDSFGIFVFILIIIALAWYATLRTKKETDGKINVHTTEQLEVFSPQTNIKLSKHLMNEAQNNTAAKHALDAFHHGDSKIKKQAVEILDKLGEVEKF